MEQMQFKINICLMMIAFLIITLVNNVNYLYKCVNKQQYDINLLQNNAVLKHLFGSNCYKNEDGNNIYNLLNEYKDNPYMQNKIRVLLIEYLVSLQEIKENSNIVENQNKIINNEIKCYIDNLLVSMQDNR
jgi:hypothetical protein